MTIYYSNAFIPQFNTEEQNKSRFITRSAFMLLKPSAFWYGSRYVRVLENKHRRCDGISLIIKYCIKLPIPLSGF